MPALTAAPQHTYEAVATVDFTGLVSPGCFGKVLASGTFTPVADMAILRVTGCCEFLEGSSGHARLEFRYGDPSLSPLTPHQTPDPVVAGLTKVDIANIAAQNAPYAIEKELTGLTPGKTLAWEISTRIVGGKYTVFGVPEPILAFAYQQIFDFNGSGALNSATRRQPGEVYVAGRGAHKLMLFRSNHYKQPGENLLVGSVTLTSSTAATRPAMLPDGSVVYVPNFDTSKLAKVTVPDLTLDETASLPAGRTGPTDAVASPDGTTIWVVCLTTGHLCKYVVGTGFDDTKTLSLGETNSAAYVSVNPAGTRLYVTMLSTKTVKVIDISGSTPSLVTTVGPIGSGALKNVAVTPDATKGYITSGAALYTIDLVTNALTGPTTISGLTTPGQSHVMSDGKALFISDQVSGVGTAQVYQINVPDLTQFQRWPNAEKVGVTPETCPDLALAPYGAIFAPGNVNAALNIWPGGRFSQRPATVNGEFLNVQITPAS